MTEDLSEGIVDIYVNDKVPPEEWDLKSLSDKLFQQFSLKLGPGSPGENEGPEELKEKIRDQVWKAYLNKVETIGPELMASLEQMIMLETIDNSWKDHLLSMDHLKEGIGLRGYGQRDPLREYQREGYELFIEMIERSKEQTVANLFRIQLAREADQAQLAAREEKPMFFSHGGEEPAAPQKRESKKVGRNEPCPCGSGKKYKRCCGQK
jgi:preprotein translocase subunit SecA